MCLSLDLLEALFRAVLELLLQGVIVHVPVSECFHAFYSNLFMVLKKEGKVHTILDFKALNGFVRLQKLRIESIRRVVVSLHPGENSIISLWHYPWILPLLLRSSRRC